MTPEPILPWAWRCERVVALGLGGVLLTSAVAHLGNPYRLLSTVYSYQLVGPAGGLFVAATVPTIQVSLALCLALRWWPAGAFLAAFGLFAGFFVAQAAAQSRGLGISCGCFGGDAGVPIGPVSLAFAGTCAVSSVVGWLLARWVDKRSQGGGPCETAAAAGSR